MFLLARVWGVHDPLGVEALILRATWLSPQFCCFKKQSPFRLKYQDGSGWH